MHKLKFIVDIFLIITGLKLNICSIKYMLIDNELLLALIGTNF